MWSVDLQLVNRGNRPSSLFRGGKSLEAGSDKAAATAPGRVDVHRWSHRNMLLMLNYHLPDTISVVVQANGCGGCCHQAVVDGPGGGSGGSGASGRCCRYAPNVTGFKGSRCFPSVCRRAGKWGIFWFHLRWRLNKPELTFLSVSWGNTGSGVRLG